MKKMWRLFSTDDLTCVFPVWNQWILCAAALLCLLVLPVKTDAVCPSSCTCTGDTVACLSYDGDAEVPMDIPTSTSTLILHGKNISTLPQGAFTVNGTEAEIQNLQLSHNGIRVIEPYAFLGLPRLRSLDLSHNRLEFISSRAFRGLPELRSLYLNSSVSPGAAAQLSHALNAQNLRNLHRLELAGNGLKTIPLERLDIYSLHTLVLINNSIENINYDNISSLYQQRRTRVYLALNPFRCTCELKEFYFWLKNSSQCPDAGELLCSEPEAQRGVLVENLQGEDLDCMNENPDCNNENPDCINENLEAVSYVFLGIVLALIGVVFLMVLYLNRRGIKRWLNNIREACRDQMEVYHYRYEQDTDPRLANVAV